MRLHYFPPFLLLILSISCAKQTTEPDGAQMVKWEQTGLQNFWANALAVSGDNVYAGGGGSGTGIGYGVFRSSDNGLRWIPTSLDSIQVSGFATSGTNLFTAGSGGVFVSTDNGFNWATVNNELETFDISVGRTHTSVSAISVNGTDIFVGASRPPPASLTDSIFVSTNNGSSWKAVQGVGLPLFLNFSAFAFVRGNMFAATQQGIFLSPDKGANWTAVNTGLTDLLVGVFFVNDSTIFAGTFSKGVFCSTNSGTDWIPMSTGLDTNPAYVQAFATIDKTLFVGSYSGIFLSSDNGRTWTQNLAGIGPVFSLAVKDRFLFAGTYQGVFRGTMQ